MIESCGIFLGCNYDCIFTLGTLGQLVQLIGTEVMVVGVCHAGDMRGISLDILHHRHGIGYACKEYYRSVGY